MRLNIIRMLDKSINYIRSILEAKVDIQSLTIYKSVPHVFLRYMMKDSSEIKEKGFDSPKDLMKFIESLPDYQ